MFPTSCEPAKPRFSQPPELPADMARRDAQSSATSCASSSGPSLAGRKRQRSAAEAEVYDAAERDQPSELEHPLQRLRLHDGSAAVFRPNAIQAPHRPPSTFRPTTPEPFYVERRWALSRIHEGLRLGQPQIIEEVVRTCTPGALLLDEDEQFTLGVLALSGKSDELESGNDPSESPAPRVDMAGLQVLLASGILQPASSAVRRLLRVAVRIHQSEGLRLLLRAASSMVSARSLGALGDDRNAHEAAALAHSLAQPDSLLLLSEGFALSLQHCESRAPGIE